MGRRKLDMDKMVLDLILASDLAAKHKIAKKIFTIAYKNGIYPSSIHDFYMARGRKEFSGFTVPAINLRALTFDLAKAIFRVAKNNNTGSFIFEIAKSEMGYTDQPPIEYTGVILAAAIKEEYKGPVFIQGDHFQANAKKYKENPQKEIDSLKELITEAIESGFYNIDIDSSTLVDLSRKTTMQQQEDNFKVAAELTAFIRKLQPRGVNVSVGGEIGEVGHANSNPEELHAYMKGYRKSLRKNYQGLSKISVQTGTSHGGVVLPDGSIAQVKLDFETLRTLSEIARNEYGMAGAVQHGASTLPAEAFHKFPEVETAEVHLATEFQNMLYESKHFPKELKDKMYAWINANLQSEKKSDQTEEQFIYSARKKALGPFKKDIMGLAADVRTAIAKEVEAKFDFLFKQLKNVNNRELIDKFITLKRVVIHHKEEVEEKERDTEGAD
ncbi:MAG TPA: class II fructose-bisphosphate aldolase [Candidatus Omnitrophota bacterium]|nr:class II fructose-bisphosphate aldolase [Candidatus Omnitrophota bacterium]